MPKSCLSNTLEVLEGAQKEMCKGGLMSIIPLDFLKTYKEARLPGNKKKFTSGCPEQR